ncbi:MAG: adenosylcobinamide-phosphate synthase [Acidimicrobiales bacterium]
MRSLDQRCLGAAAGLVADRLLGDPPNQAHPVAWFGKAMQLTETALWADRRAPGIAHAAVGIGLGSGAGHVVRSTAVMVAVTVSGRQLRQTAERIGQAVESGDLDRARRELPALVGRDPTDLDASGLAAAVIESVAENSVDAVVAPIFWAAIGGAVGAGGYRAINTMDAMIGHRSTRYRHFGWAAARIDDVANYLPARIFAALIAAQTPAKARGILSAIRRDAPAHPSPNAGVAETAVAAALGCQLGGPLRYGADIERRPTLGTGPRPSPADIPAAIRLANRAELTLVALLTVAWATNTLRSTR